MKLIIVCALLCVVAISAAAITEETRFSFSLWAKQHGKVYASPVEANRRLQVFADNMEFANKHNSGSSSSYTLGATKFADLTNEEYRSMYLGGYKRSANRTAAPGGVFHYVSNVALPTTVDWRQKGVVTAVKDQGQCGSCWSFSATGSMEGAHALSTGNLIALSEQQLIDCVNNGQYTCDTGGEMQDGFQYVISNGGIESEDEYPYCTCSGNQCAFDQSQVVATFSSYQALPQGDEQSLQAAVAAHPGVSIAIDASSQQFQLYTGGVFDLPSCSSSQLDHGVLIVGYGTYQGSDYWLVKNSWSASWGLQGYIMMSRNKNNQCGVATDASYVVA